jgi:hypothetical protein
MMPKITPVLLALSLMPLAAAEKWTVDDVLFVERAGGLELSKDG